MVALTGMLTKLQELKRLWPLSKIDFVRFLHLSVHPFYLADLADQFFWDSHLGCHRGIGLGHRFCLVDNGYSDPIS